MSGKTAKKIRKAALRAAEKRDAQILPELKQFINQQPFLNRCRIAVRILQGRF